MSFSVRTKLLLEYRGRTEGTTKKGEKWVSLKFEDEAANQLEVSVPRTLQEELAYMTIYKGDVLEVPINAVARYDGRSYVQMTGLPQVVDGD